MDCKLSALVSGVQFKKSQKGKIYCQIHTVEPFNDGVGERTGVILSGDEAAGRVIEHALKANRPANVVLSGRCGPDRRSSYTPSIWIEDAKQPQQAASPRAA